MISAKTARNNSFLKESREFNNQIRQIDGLIRKAAYSGKTKVCLSYFLMAPVKAELEKLGYKIESANHRNEQHTNISWAE